MKTPRSAIAEVVTEKLAAGKAKRLSKDIAAYLLETGRTGELESLLRDIVRVRAENGIVEVTATSAHALSEAARADLRRTVRVQFPQAKQVLINEQLDPAVLGGIRLELPGEQLDTSVRSRLNRFKQLTTAGE